MDAINDAIAAGVTIVAAAGNEAEMQVDFPANNPNVIAVSAVRPDFMSSDFTNYGRKWTSQLPEEIKPQHLCMEPLARSMG